MTTVAVTPTLGSAPVTLQAGNYSAIDDRRFWGAGVREGVVSGGSYQVIQRAAGANMTVDVASSVGSGAVVQGDSVTAQGNYFVPPTAANANVTIATSDATNPRNDLVVLEVKDDQHDAGGLNLARVRVITGTPNGSAGANDAPGANGTPALPSSCLLLAVVRVTAGATSVTTAMINDRRPWAGGVPTFETSLPSPAADGQEVYFTSTTAGTGGGASNTMSGQGIIWHLRFRNAFNGGNATYPWEVVNGPPIMDRVGTDEGVTGTAYAALATAGPQLTLPRPGDYIVTLEARSYHATAGTLCQMSYDIGATGAVDADSLQNFNGVSSSPSWTGAGSQRKTFTSAVALVAKYKSGTTNGRWAERTIRVQPVRIG